MEETKGAHFLIGKRVTDKDALHHMQSVDLSVQKIERPTVLVLGGANTLDNRSANGYAKLVESMLGDFAGDVDILSVNYNHCANYYSKILEENIIKLTKDIFVPLISRDGKRLGLEEACKNVRKLTIFAHCFGYNEIAIGIQEVLFNLLAQFGYNPTESGRILEQVFVVAFGTEIEQDWFKSVNVVSPFDSSSFETSTQIWEELLESDIDSCEFITEKDKEELKKIAGLSYWKRVDAIKEFCEKNQRCFVVRNGKRISLATSMLKTEVDDTLKGFNFNEHRIKEFARDEKWQSYGALTASGEQTSRCLAVSLCTGVANSVLNESSNAFVPLDIDELEGTLSGLVYAFNTQPTVALDSSVYSGGQNGY